MASAPWDGCPLSRRPSCRRSRTAACRGPTPATAPRCAALCALACSQAAAPSCSEPACARGPHILSCAVLYMNCVLWPIRRLHWLPEQLSCRGFLRPALPAGVYLCAVPGQHQDGHWQAAQPGHGPRVHGEQRQRSLKQGALLPRAASLSARPPAPSTACSPAPRVAPFLAAPMSR